MPQSDSYVVPLCAYLWVLKLVSRLPSANSYAAATVIGKLLRHIKQTNNNGQWSWWLRRMRCDIARSSSFNLSPMCTERRSNYNNLVHLARNGMLRCFVALTFRWMAAFLLVFYVNNNGFWSAALVACNHRCYVCQNSAIAFEFIKFSFSVVYFGSDM